MTCYTPSMTNASRRMVDHDDQRREDHFTHLREATWDDYLRILEIRGDHSAPRITYLEGVVEIMSPSRQHESIKSIIGRLIEVWCLERDVSFSTYGSWTLHSKESERGAEPDECYVFGEVDAPTRPDLAIEVIWTTGGIDKLEVYRGLGVREVWIWRRGRIQPYLLGDGTYGAVDTSVVLPGLDLAMLASFLDRKTTSEAIRGYRDALASGD